MRILIYILVLQLSTISSSRNRRADFAENEDVSSKLFFTKGKDSLYDVDDYNSNIVFTNKWAVHVAGGAKVADELAYKHGFRSNGPLGSLKDFYLFEHSELGGRTRRSLEHHNRLINDRSVKWAKQQKILSRQKRDSQADFPDPTDPLFSKQWYLKNTGQTPCPEKRLDINVFPVWKRKITGKGVVVTILDDGLEHTHPDLKKNYEPAASYDFNSSPNDNDPFPKYSADNINKHGTRCAGEVAAGINNGRCGVGVAYNSRVGGIRMLDGDVTDAVEAGSLSYNPLTIDIYSSSWGPDDDGKTVDGPGHLAQKAFKDGIKNGRHGLGSIFVWATGNGGRFNDYCSCDGYINSIYTISIGAVDDCGRSPWYAEPCPGTLAVTYSSGVQRGADKQISTTDLHHSCTEKHTGTSAAAPLAAGVFALVLEANPKLTWRDLQHLIVKTSKVTSNEDPEWQTNQAGFKMHAKFGFGVLDADGLVKAAQAPDWQTADPQHVCKSKEKQESKTIPAKGSVTSTIYTSGCAGQPACITAAEHVHAYVTIKHTRRGGLIIDLISPTGIKSPLLKQRMRDMDDKGFQYWPFLTVFNWGENPKGKWKLIVTDRSGRPGVLVEWSLRFYGTCDVSLFNITVNETQTCTDECKKDCPVAFSEKCLGCNKYCNCETGQCVTDCDDHLIADHDMRHCRRAFNPNNVKHGATGLPSNMYAGSSAIKKADDNHIKPLVGIPVSAKFAIIALSAAVLIGLGAGIVYFVLELPRRRKQLRGTVSYHPVRSTRYVVDISRLKDDIVEEGER